jgi:NADH:ubiquinone oxidoreductase subunit 5 (subunit L)/multisubunit Na+/H+ antiporter MnhA subunit
VASKHKFWFDELYRYTVVGGTVVLSRVVARFDLTVIDGIVNAVGWGTRVVVASLIRWFDLIVIDGALNAMAFVTGLVGEAGARLQSGRVQDYVAGLAIFAATVAAAVAAATLWFRIGMPWP